MSGSFSIPRLVVAGTSSGVGKTTVVVGLIAALRARGLRVAAFKCGPDYLDPSYHRRASGGAGHNLDGWMMGREAVLATFARASREVDVAVIEGVMGLFDGASATSDEGSTAEVARWLDAPVLLVVDASGMARTIGAVAQGFATFDAGLHLAGLLANRVGSRGHLDLLRQSAPVVPILGGLPKALEHAFPERHLGLRTADPEAIPDDRIQAWGQLVADWFDLEAIVALARSAPALPGQERLAPNAHATTDVRIGIAHDEAFHFYYEDNLARLEAAGAELVRFSPVHDDAVPEVDGLYLGGGYPETVAGSLAANRSMIDSIRALARAGGPIYAECGGLMYLCREIRTVDGHRHPMVGLIDAQVVVRDKLQALGYVEVETEAETPLGPPGTAFRGHQFRYSELVELPEGAPTRYTVTRRRGGTRLAEGLGTDNVLASYVHAHWASNPQAAVAFVQSCRAYRQARTSA